MPNTPNDYLEPYDDSEVFTSTGEYERIEGDEYEER